jgi:hypothetical protein
MKYILIVFIAISLLLAVWGTISTCIAVSLNTKIATLQTNVRTLEGIKTEYLKKQENYKRQQDAYDELKKATTVREFVTILKKFDLKKESK